MDSPLQREVEMESVISGKALTRVYQLAKGETDYEALVRGAIAMNDSDCKMYLVQFIQNMDEARELVAALYELLVDRGKCHNH